MGPTIPVVLGGPTWSSWTKIPGQKTNVGLAAVSLKGFATLGLALAKEDGGVSVNYLNDAGAWLGWKTVPGIGPGEGIATTVGPCATTSLVDGSLVLYAVAGDEQVFVNSTADGHNWNGWKTVHGAKTNYPLCAGPDRNLYMVGLSGHIWVAPNPPADNWRRLAVTGGTFPGDVFRSNAGLCMVAPEVLGGPNSLLAKSLTDDKIWVCGLPSQGQPPESQGWREFGGTTDVGLAGSTIPGETYCLFATGRHNDIYFQGYASGEPGASVAPGWNKVPGFRTNAALAAAGVLNIDLVDGVSLWDVYVFAKGVVEGDVQYIIAQWAFEEQ
jgi:hypothetical protein